MPPKGKLYDKSYQEKGHKMEPLIEFEYEEIDGLLYPLVERKEKEDRPIGVYGQMRLDYLKEHNEALRVILLMRGELTDHLIAVDRAANEYMRTAKEQGMKRQGITEELKHKDCMEWARRVTSIVEQARAQMIREIIRA
jgi:hypothetical protein